MTNGGLEIDPVFNTQLFIVMLKMVDINLREIWDVLSFIKNLFDYNPRAFTEEQTVALLLRLSLVGILSLEYKQTENSLEVC